MTTHNTREQDNETTKQMIAEFDEESKGDDLTQKIVGLLGIHGVAVKFEGYTDGSHITNKFVEVFHQELQKAREERDKEWHKSIEEINSNVGVAMKTLEEKARHDWLREEIVKLEGMKRFISGEWPFDKQMAESSHNQALQTIIDRYQSELDQPTDVNTK